MKFRIDRIQFEHKINASPSSLVQCIHMNAQMHCSLQMVKGGVLFNIACGILCISHFSHHSCLNTKAKHTHGMLTAKVQYKCSQCMQRHS
uniref:Uncharacterized protein n=1 Tax=Rhipicephalus zambeziensis TaxID=60191 RepID=A0A224YL10_9ACAR